MKKVWLSLITIGVLAFGIGLSMTNDQTAEAEQQNLPILPPY